MLEYRISFVFFLVTFLAGVSGSFLEPGDIRNVAYTKEVLKWIENEYKSINFIHPTKDSSLSRLRKKSEEILNNLDKIDIRFTSEVRRIRSWIESMKDDKIKRVLSTLMNGYIKTVYELYLIFVEHMKKYQPTLTQTLYYSYEIFDSNNNSITHYPVYEIDNFFSHFRIDDVHTIRTRCNDRFSPQEIFYEIYSILMMMEISRFTIITYNSKVLQILDNRTRVIDEAAIKKEIDVRTDYYYNKVQGFLMNGERSYRHCEPRTASAAKKSVKTMNGLFPIHRNHQQHENYTHQATDTFKISLDPVLSFAQQNWVITGVTLNVESSLLYLNIEQAEIAKNWSIIPHRTWKEYPEIRHEFHETPTALDYVVISPEEYNTINLDDVIVSNQRVITGVKFAVSEKGESPKRIELRVQSMVYHPETGYLNQKSAKWTSSSIANDKEVQLDNMELEIPTRTLVANTIVSQPGQFVKFQRSSLKTDAGKSVVPFIENKFFDTLPRTPLTGVGLYHKRSQMNAGFLAVRFFSPDYFDILSTLQLPLPSLNPKPERERERM